jgi:hypothetical protein
MQIDLVTSARWQASEPGAFHGNIRLGIVGPTYLRTELRFTATWTTRDLPCKVSVRRRDHTLFQVQTDLAKQEMLTRPGSQDEITFLADVVMPAILDLLAEISLKVDPTILLISISKDVTLNDGRSIRVECNDDSIVRHALIKLLKMDDGVSRPRG